MASSSKSFGLAPEPDLYPLYPSAPDVSRLLSTSSGLTPQQKAALVSHCMMRAAVFGELVFFQYILQDRQAHPYLDLNYRDEDGLVYASVIILGFGAGSDRDVEREECVRLLISEGADVSIPDNAGWTPLHHAALLAPPTLISFLLTRGSSPLTMTHRQMTALDLVTAYSVIPGREDVALFLEEAMRGEGWQTSKMSVQRKLQGKKLEQSGKREAERVAVMDILGLSERWWRQSDTVLPSSDVPSESGTEEDGAKTFTPPLDYSSMLVFSPDSLPGILDNLISNFRPIAQNTDPANALYMLARFACLTCDHTWLEDLAMSATDAIEDVAFNHPDDLTYTVFWLFNCTVWLHLMRCDNAISETCELLGSFDLIEEIINTVYVLIIRVAERRIDKLIDTALLDYFPAEAELDHVQFESEWSLFRSPFSKKKLVSQSITPSSTANSLKHLRPASPVPLPSHPSSPVLQQGLLAHAPNSFSSLGQRAHRSRAVSNSLHCLFADRHRANAIQELVLYLTALHLLLTDSGINPAIIIQLWSQIIYWTASEVFNRILTRKRYLCRSRAIQIGLNLSILEEWIEDAGFPVGISSHLTPARELLTWLQCLSSMDDFLKLIATIQTLKHLNPLQMRRAVRDYRYEVNELRMNDDCSQYLAQLQKDWERQRVKLGVEALRKEIKERGNDFDDDDSFSSGTPEIDGSLNHDNAQSIASVDDPSSSMSSVDQLIGGMKGRSNWMPQQPPEVLGELLESRYMLPLQLPSDPSMLAAVASSFPWTDENSIPEESKGRVLNWIAKGKQMRHVRAEMLDWLDGSAGFERRARRQRDVSFADEGQSDMELPLPSPVIRSDGQEEYQAEDHVHLTRLARSASSRSKQGRSRTG